MMMMMSFFDLTIIFIVSAVVFLCVTIALILCLRYVMRRVDTLESAVDFIHREVFSKKRQDRDLQVRLHLLSLSKQKRRKHE